MRPPMAYRPPRRGCLSRRVSSALWCPALSQSSLSRWKANSLRCISTVALLRHGKRPHTAPWSLVAEVSRTCQSYGLLSLLGSILSTEPTVVKGNFTTFSSMSLRGVTATIHGAVDIRNYFYVDASAITFMQDLEIAPRLIQGSAANFIIPEGVTLKFLNPSGSTSLNHGFTVYGTLDFSEWTRT